MKQFDKNRGMTVVVRESERRIMREKEKYFRLVKGQRERKERDTEIEIEIERRELDTVENKIWRDRG